MRRIGVFVLLVMVGISGAAWASGMGKMESSSPSMSSQRSPHDVAVQAFNDGIGSRDRAAKLEKELEATTDAGKQASLKSKIEKAYSTAVRQQSDAVRLDPNLYQAQTELGYAYRKLGKYSESLAAYESALSKQPNYAEAIEYRAEAYLGLNRVGDAKDSYLRLFEGGDPKGAAQLAAAMKRWVSARRTDPGGVAQSDIDTFAKWLESRKEIAAQNGATSSGSW